MSLLKERLPETKRLRGTFILRLAILLCVAVSGCRWSSTGQNAMGVRMYQQGRYAEALQQFQVAQATDPSNPDAYYNLASTYHKIGVAQKDQKVIEQAESLYNQCLDLNPNHVDCHRGLAVLLVESGRRDSAVLLLDQWSRNNPGLSDPKIELARLNKELGKPELAARYVDEALQANTQDARAWAARALLREEAGEYAQALQDYQQSLALNGMQVDVAQKVASLNVRLAQNAISTQPNRWTAQNPQPGGQQRY